MGNAKCSGIAMFCGLSHEVFYRSQKLKASKFEFSSFLFHLIEVVKY
jgi:hypothetical protein